MEFRLIYEGPLHGQGAKSPHKWEIRRALSDASLLLTIALRV